MKPSSRSKAIDNIKQCHKHGITAVFGGPCYMCEREANPPLSKVRKKAKPRKPKDLALFDGSAEYHPEEYDYLGGAASGLHVNAFIYDGKNARKLAKWLILAALYLERKDLK